MRKDRPPVKPHAPKSPAPEVRAAEHLRFIREMMARSGSFTAVPGWGMVAMGVTALPTALIAGLQTTPDRWLAVWLLDAALAASLGMVALAAFNLMLDFDLIERGVEAGAPKWMDWFAAFGLLVTIVWLYIEILRLLAKLQSRD